MDRVPLVSTYTFPVSQPREIRAVCNPSMPLLPEDELLHEDLSGVQGGARFEMIEKRIRMADRQYVRELVTGHAGSGKSTELLRLAARLREPKGTQSFHVVYLDAFEYVSQWGIRLPHIIIALLAALAQQERDDLKDTRSAKKLVSRIKSLAGSVSKDIAKDIDTLAHIPILTTALRASQELSSKFRDQAVTQIQDLLRELNILTYPISLNYSNVELLRVFPGSNKTTLPMVSVRLPPGSPERGGDREGIAALRHLLLRRVKREVFADDEAIEHVIRLSGGCVRDLMRFVGELPIVGEPPFTRDHVTRAVQDFKNDYERIWLGKPYVRHLPAIEQSGRVSDDLAPDWKREILLGLVVLEYDTDTWFDVHPLAKLTRTFTAARNG